MATPRRFMNTPNELNLNLASELRRRMAGNELPPAFAKLYSQYTRLTAKQPGLSRWQETEAISRFNDAMKILEAATIEKESGIENWSDGFRRTAELFEWLSAPELRPEQLPIHLFSAALYQIAGFPARADGLLNNLPTSDIEANSEIITLLLKADFRGLFIDLAKSWISNNLDPNLDALQENDADRFSNEINNLVIKETVSALGILCSYMRWGDDNRLQQSLLKLTAITNLLLHGGDSYSWLLAKLTKDATQIYTETTLRHFIVPILQNVDTNGKTAIERYIRQSYLGNRCLAWPSQVRGIERLYNNQSFALCTPTGSGKTTVAEIAILQSLFLSDESNAIKDDENVPLAIYLVPSRALATEVEMKLTRVLRHLEGDPAIIVTGLYGGTDWGPTDAWLTANDRTILICTYEKAEALLRFLGPLFVNRIKLVIIDEAHSVQFAGNISELESGDNRSLRLEALGMRLLRYVNLSKGRAIALSAVASGSEQALAGWITGDINSDPEKTYYRSTRQLVGRLECKPNRHFEIRYDLLDGSSLSFTEDGEDNTPYIIDPFPPCPPVNKPKTGVESRLWPSLFWAAMNFAAVDADGHRHPVLISLTQSIGNYAEEFLNLLEDWKSAHLPDFFEEPKDPTKQKIWLDCLSSCRDYFSEDSFEYQLLIKGIAVHHGKMPGLMGRLLIQVVREQIIHLVLATSTLTEGVNLPFEIILIPTLRRSTSTLDAREFGNLIGRAGRPGVGTEGKSLVLLASEKLPGDKRKEIDSLTKSRMKYLELIKELTISRKSTRTPKRPKSPIAELIKHLKECWDILYPTRLESEFLDWLERTSPIEFSDDLLTNPRQRSAIETLDTLDGLLLSTIVELEQLANKDIGPDELENGLKEIWQRSFAYYASLEEKTLGEIFLQRGRSIKKVIVDSTLRRRLYCTSLQPRSGLLMLHRVPILREHLSTGKPYAEWNSHEKIEYIRKTVELVSEMPKFKLDILDAEDFSWADILLWWLDHKNTKMQPDRKQLSKWYDYVSKNFAYRFNWGMGSIVALIIDEAHGGQLKETKLEEWSQTQLPWIVLWIKELITWGTLEPVAAYLLSQGMENNREDAEKAADIYYSQKSGDIHDQDALLDPREIRKWATNSLKTPRPKFTQTPNSAITVKLHRDFSKTSINQWRVMPVEVDNRQIQWFDPAGFLFATSEVPGDWNKSYLSDFDFILDTSRRIITSTPYL
jgi:hypothetical protein